MNDIKIKAVAERWFYWVVLGIPAGLSLITFLTYYQSLWYGFMFDDLPTITQYIHTRYIDFAGQFFGNPRWISRLMNQITFFYWKNNPFAYRIVDIAMHLAIGVLIFATVWRLLRNVKKSPFLHEHSLAMATLTSMFFLLHPVQTQTVTYITQMRLEGLVALLSMMVLTTFTFAATTTNQRNRNILYAISFVCMAFAAGTKEIIIVLPPLLVIVDWFFIAEGDLESLKSRWMLHAGYWLTLYGVLFKYGYLQPRFIRSISTEALVHNNRGNILTGSASENISVYFFAISQFKIFLHYFWMFFWPFNISFDYDVKLSPHWYSLDVVIPALVVCALFAALVWLYQRRQFHIIVFGFVWFALTMLPRTSIFPTTELICDYKTYPAALGMMLILAFLVLKLYQRVLPLFSLSDQHQVYGVGGVTAVCCIALALASGVRSQVWSSEYAFWGDVITKAPKARVFNNYAIALWEMGRKDEALLYFNKAIEKDDFYAEPHVNLATIFQMGNDFDKAMEHYKRALEIGEAHPELFNNLGMLHFSKGNWASAEYCLKQAIKLRPFASKTQVNLGRVYEMTNRTAQAMACYENAIKGDEVPVEAWYAYGSLAMHTGRFHDAIKSLSKLNIEYQDVAFLLGCCYYSLPSYTKAVEYFTIAHKKDPNNKILTYNYAQALLNTRKFDQALELFNTCVNEPDKYPYAVLHRAKCLYELGQRDQAQGALKKLLTSNAPKEVLQDARSLQKELKLA